MSKVGFFLRGARGTVGDVTLKKGQNGTIMSVKADKVRNPKTPKQSAQRIIFTLIAYATTFLKPLVNHSFEGKNGTNENLQEFRRLNLERFRALSAMQYAYDQDPSHEADSWFNAMYTIKGIKTLIPNSYIVSQGSLNYHGALGVDMDSSVVVCHLPEVDITSKVTFDDNAVYMDLSDLFDTLLGISDSGEQFTVVGVQTNFHNVLWEMNSDNVQNHKIKQGGRLIRRIVIAEGAVDSAIQIGSISGGSVTPSTWDNVKADIMNFVDVSKTDMNFLKTLYGNLAYSYSNSELKIASTDFEPGVSNGYTQVNALGYIISKLDGNTWRYSNCVLTTLPPESAEDFEYGLPWKLANQYWERAYVNAPAASFLDTGIENTTNLDA